MFGIGYFPLASGTVMSAVAIPPAIWIGWHGGGLAVLVASILAFVIGIAACDRHVRATGREDEALFQALVATVNGIAAGLQATG